MPTPNPPEVGVSEFGATPFGPIPASSIVCAASAPGVLVIAGGTNTAVNYWHTQINYIGSFVVTPALSDGVGLDLRQWGGNVNAGAHKLANLATARVNTSIQVGSLYFSRKKALPYLGFNVDAASAFSFADAAGDYLSVLPGTGIGFLKTNPSTPGDIAGALTMRPTSTPAAPSVTNESREYISASGYAVEQYNDAGTVRYKYMDLKGSGVTWQHSTTAP